MGRGGEQPALQSRAVHAGDSHAEADSGPPCVNEEPDLELGLLRNQNADLASALHSNEANQSRMHASRSVVPCCSLSQTLNHSVLCFVDDCAILLIVQTDSLRDRAANLLGCRELRSPTKPVPPCSRGRPDANQPSHAARELLSRARVLALQQTERLESLSEQKEYSESLLDEGAALENEHYTDRCM